MLFSSTHSPSLKVFRMQLTQKDSKNPVPPLLHKLSPLPVFRKDLLNNSRIRKRLRVDGYKYFAKLPASGPETQQILQNLKNSRCHLKLIQSFEFDPYLCDDSNISHLRKICHKVNTLRRINLVIRRVNFPRELEALSPFITRFLRVRYFRIEFPNTSDVHEYGLIKLASALKKCPLLKSVGWKDVNMPERSTKFGAALSDSLFKLKWLEHYESYETLKKGSFRNENDELQYYKKAKQSNLRTLELSFSTAGEWASLGSEKDLQMEALAYLFQKQQHLQKVKFCMIKSFCNYEDALCFLNAIAQIKGIRSLEYEYLGCRINDMDVLVFIYGLAKIKSLQYFSFKVIQNPNVSEECIQKFAEAVSKFDNLLKFDLYFRRMNLHPQALKDLGKRISSLPNTQYVSSHGSIHIFRMKNDDYR